MAPIKSIITGVVIWTTVLAGSASFASACGNEMIYPLLFRAYPEAGRAFDAEQDALRAGDLATVAWAPVPGQTYHQWSLSRARKVVDRLAARLHRAAPGEGADDTLSILLSAEVYVAELHPGSPDAALAPLRVGHPKGDIGLYTTASALRALVDGRMRWQEAVEKDLVILTGSADRRARVVARLSKALSDSALAN